MSNVAIRKYLNGLAAKLGRIVLVGAKESIRTVVYVTTSGSVFHGKIGSGELYNSLLVDISIVGDFKIKIVLYAAEHLQWILSGRPPHPGDDSKLIPILGERGRKFRQWSEKKGLNPYVVRRSIQKNGIAPLAIDKAIAENVRSKIVHVVKKDLVAAYNAELVEWLRDSIVNN